MYNKPTEYKYCQKPNYKYHTLTVWSISLLAVLFKIQNIYRNT